MTGGLWRRNQRRTSSATPSDGGDATGPDDAPAGEEGVAEALVGREASPAAGRPRIVLVDQFADRSATLAGAGASTAVAPDAPNAMEGSKWSRRGFRRPANDDSPSPDLPVSPLVETCDRETARCIDELTQTLQRAEQAVSEANRLREAVAAAQEQTRLATRRQADVHTQLDEEYRAEAATLEQRRRSEAAALEHKAEGLDQANSEKKRLRVESYQAAVSGAARARAESQRETRERAAEARERAAEARAAADRAEAAARALEAAAEEIVGTSEAEEKRTVAEAEARARADADATGAEVRAQEEQRAARIEAFKLAESERANERELAAGRTRAAAAAQVAAAEAALGELEASLADGEREAADAARAAAAGKEALVEAERLARAARQSEARTRRAREALGAVREGARGAEARAAAARTEAERATATAQQAAAEAAELLREAQRLSAELLEAEQQTMASARALESPGPELDEVSTAPEAEIDLTAAETADSDALGEGKVVESSEREGRPG